MLNNYLLTFRSTFAEQWVKNSLSSKELHQKGELLGINLEANHYTVVIFSSHVHDISKMSKFYEMVLSTFIGKFMSTIYFENPQRFACVLSQTNTQEADLKPMIKKAEAASLALSYPVFISIGNTVPDCDKVYESYENAHQMLFVQYTGIKTFVYQPNMNSVKNCVAKSFSKFDSLETANEEELIEITQDLLKKSSILSTSEVVSFFIISNLIQKLDIDVLELPDHYNAVYKLLTAYSTYKNSISVITNFTISFIQELKFTLSEAQNYYPFVDAVIKSVLDFSDKDISLKTLATKLNMSSSYLGNIFKKQTGYYFNDYLTEARLKYAAQLILTTDMKMKEIVDHVGFSSQTYFNRTFKRYYKVSPLSYRRNNKLDDLM